MNSSYTYKPVTFFISTFLISWTFWLIAIYASWHQSASYLLFPCILGGISGPTIATLLLFSTAKNKNVWSDFFQRLRIFSIKISYLFAVLVFMPCLILLAISISVLFGQSPDQFLPAFQSSDPSLGKNIIMIFAILGLSCSAEELGWRGYGIESLRNRYNLFKTSLLFATLWCLWHGPLLAIKDGYFQKELLNLGILHSINYCICLFAITLLINWLYIKNNRSILIAILAHMMINFSLILFQIQQNTKFIIMILLVASAGIVVAKNKYDFFKQQK